MYSIPVFSALELESKFKANDACEQLTTEFPYFNTYEHVL